MNEPILGELITGDARRDAVHIAVAPVVAESLFAPGQHVGVRDGGKVATTGGQHVGIIDPLLREAVRPGDRCWLWLYPKSITSLRHMWTHPAFKAASPTL